MYFQKKQAIGKSNYLIKLIIKIALVFFLFFIILLLVDQINFEFHLIEYYKFFYLSLFCLIT